MPIEGINYDELLVFQGCCCNYGLCYFDFPSCVGCTQVSECLCIGHECCLSSTHPPLTCDKKENMWCQIGCYILSIYLKAPTTCCKGSGHCCCQVGECSFPPEQDMPCICAMYGLTCVPKFGCCLKYSEVKK